MKSAIEYLKNIEGKRKIAVLGDMLELGEYSKELHEKVGLEVVKNKIDILITVGKEAENIARVAKDNGIEHVYTFDNNNEATEKLKKIIAVASLIILLPQLNGIINIIIKITIIKGQFAKRGAFNKV